jgi:hypothetical protein
MELLWQTIERTRGPLWIPAFAGMTSGGIFMKVMLININ